MDFAYQKLMEEHSLSYADLPKDAKIGIDIIKEIERAITLAEKKGKKITPKTYEKLRINDRFVVSEILDHIGDDDSDQNKPDRIITAAEIKHDMEQEPKDPKGFVIEGELKALFDANETKLDVEGLRVKAPNTYAHLFKTHKEGEENGIETTLYKVLENATDKLFYITKN